HYRALVRRAFRGGVDGLYLLVMGRLGMPLPALGTLYAAKRFISSLGREAAPCVTCFARSRIAPHEPEAVHPCRYRGPAAGRFAAVAHARLAARRYYATRWLAETSPPSVS